MVLSPSQRLVLLDPRATRRVVLTRSGGYIDDAVRAVGVEGDPTAPVGSTWIGPAVTNKCTQPQPGATPTTGVTLAGDGAAVLTTPVDATAPFQGTSTKVWLLDNSAGVAAATVEFDGTASAAAHAALIHAYAVAGTPTISIAAAAAVNITGSAYARFRTTATASSGDKLRITCPAGAICRFTAGMLETGAVNNPYTPTSRTVARVQMPWDRGICTEAIGWAAGLVRMGHAYNSGVTTRLFQFLNSGTERIILQHVDNDAFYFERAHSGSNPSARAALSFALNDAVMWFAKWTPTDVLLSINGGAFASAGGNTAIPTLTTTFFDIGSNAGGGQQYADQAWCVVGNGLAGASDPAVVFNAFGSLTKPKPTIRALDQVARGAHVMVVWDGRGGTFDQRIAS